MPEEDAINLGLKEKEKKMSFLWIIQHPCEMIFAFFPLRSFNTLLSYSNQ